MQPNVDPGEVARFDALAGAWWDPQGELRTLHDLNVARLAWLERSIDLPQHEAIDVGCGGGLLSEGLARLGARVTGIDAAPAAIAAAAAHAAGGGLAIDYAVATAEDRARTHPGRYDLVTCMELIEHVPEPAALVAACVALARPGGDLVFSTLNRTPAAWLLAVVGAEYALRLLPRGTHDYARFVRPSELARWLRAAGADTLAIRGIAYDPFTRRARIRDGAAVNYLLHARRPERRA